MTLLGMQERLSETVFSGQHVPLNHRDSAVILIDHQPGALGKVNSLPREVVAANVGMLARLSEHSGLPLVVSTTDEHLQTSGTSIGEIQWSAPTAYARRIARTGCVNAFDDQRFTEAVEATTRRTLIMAGILTNESLRDSAIFAVEAGYHVRVIADASGSRSELADWITYARLRGLGVEVGTTYGPLFELFSDLSTPEGQLAEAIAAGNELASTT